MKLEEGGGAPQSNRRTILDDRHMTGASFVITGAVWTTDPRPQYQLYRAANCQRKQASHGYQHCMQRKRLPLDHLHGTKNQVGQNDPSQLQDVVSEMPGHHTSTPSPWRPRLLEWHPSLLPPLRNKGDPLNYKSWRGPRPRQDHPAQNQPTRTRTPPPPPCPHPLPLDSCGTSFGQRCWVGGIMLHGLLNSGTEESIVESSRTRELQSHGTLLCIKDPLGRDV